MKRSTFCSLCWSVSVSESGELNVCSIILCFGARLSGWKLLKCVSKLKMKKLSEKQRMVNRDPFQPSKELRVAFGWLSKLSPSTHLILSTFLQNKYEVSFISASIRQHFNYSPQISALSNAMPSSFSLVCPLSAVLDCDISGPSVIVPYFKQRVGNVAFWGDKHVWGCSVKCVIIYYVLIEIETGSPFTNRVWDNQGTENFLSFWPQSHSFNSKHLVIQSQVRYLQ